MVFDSFELSCNMAGKTTILNTNNVDVWESWNLKATASNVYTKGEINANDIMYDSALDTEADKSNSYTRAEPITFIEIHYTVNGSFIKIVDPANGKFRINLNSNLPINSSITTRTDIQAPSQYG